MAIQKMPKQGDVTKKQHGYGFQKMRCPGCRVGMMAVKQQTPQGQVYECERCHRQFKVGSL